MPGFIIIGCKVQGACPSASKTNFYETGPFITLIDSFYFESLKIQNQFLGAVGIRLLPFSSDNAYIICWRIFAS